MAHVSQRREHKVSYFNNFLLKTVSNYYWLVPQATNLWFRRVSHAGVLARLQRFSGVFSLVTYITCHMITAEDSRENSER